MLKPRLESATDQPPDEQFESNSYPEPDIEAVCLRNTDHLEGHSVHVSITDADNRLRLSERSYLAPGQARRLTGAFEGGEYRIKIRVDGIDRRSISCRLDGLPGGTATVEFGNGIVSVTNEATELDRA